MVSDRYFKAGVIKTDQGLSGLEYPLYFSNTLFFIRIFFLLLLIYFPSLLMTGKKKQNTKMEFSFFVFNIRNKWKKIIDLFS